MNDQTLNTLIQAEIDGLATVDEIATLDAAAATDPRVNELRQEYREMTQAVSRIPAIEAPAEFTGRVMAAIPQPRTQTARTGIPFLQRVRDIVQVAVPRPRHRVAFAFALGVVVTLGLNVVVGDLADPGTGMVTGTMAGPTELTVPLAGDAGTMETAVRDGARRIVVHATGRTHMQITVVGTGGTSPDVTLDVGDGAITAQAREGSVFIESDTSGPVAFTVRTTDPVGIRVESDGEQLLNWTSDRVSR